jgi:hypothetical protein
LKANDVREVLIQTAPPDDSINLCLALAGRQASQRCQPTPTVSRAARSD